ncbi:hypothetical protein [Fulvivirga sp.]|uniref:hypothetical protein n=1 Tax=Fulvivirga sp. TaxID=1931237 RepID=UPI0032EAD763
MRIHLITFIIISLGIFSCSSNVKEDSSIDQNLTSSALEKKKITEIDQAEQVSDIPKFDMSNTLGVLSLSSKIEIIEDDTVRLLNEDGSLWFKFTFYYDDSDGEYDYFKEEFSPFAFHPDYSLLGLIVTADKGSRYKVVVNGNNGLEKYIEKQDYLEFLKWGEYIVSKTFSVDFDKMNNPLKMENDRESSNIPYSNDEFYHPNKVEGDWLQVKWGNEDNWEYGWIRWRDGNDIIIKWYYFA